MDKQIGFFEKMQFEMMNENTNNLEVRMVLDGIHLRDLGIVHGGAISALIDYAMTKLVKSNDKSISIAKINFLKIGQGPYLIARARKLVHGYVDSPVYCEVVNDRNEIIADATGHCTILGQPIDGEIDRKFKFNSLINRNVPAHVFEEEGKIPFNEYLGIEQTYWSEGCAQVDLVVKETLKDSEGCLPSGHFMTLVDVACGQALKTLLMPHENLLTVELTLSITQNISHVKKLIARSNVHKKGRISVVSSIILNEKMQMLAYGSTTYYVKS